MCLDRGSATKSGFVVKIVVVHRLHRLHRRIMKNKIKRKGKKKRRRRLWLVWREEGQRWKRDRIY